jgi:hypothetical protein
MLLNRVAASFAADARNTGDVAAALFGRAAERGVRLLQLLDYRYAVTATNPPYMGSGNMDSPLRSYVERHYTPGKRDLYAAFILRCLDLVGSGGRVAMVTQQSWMFLGSFADLRAVPDEDLAVAHRKGSFTGLLRETSLETLAHLGPNAFEEISGEVVQSALFVTARHVPAQEHRLTALRLVGLRSSVQKAAAMKQMVTASKETTGVTGKREGSTKRGASSTLAGEITAQPRRKRPMTPEVVLKNMLPAVETVLKAVVAQALTTERPPTLYELEALTQHVLPQIGQVVLQELTRAQGSGLVGPTRPCACGAEQHYRDQGRTVVVQTSVGDIRLERRAFYHCGACPATSYPLDERLGLGQAGRMSRYLQEQCAWLLALLPGRLGRQTLLRFGWPAVPASQVVAKGEALGAEMDAREAQRLAALQAADAEPDGVLVPRQPAKSARLYAAPDALRYCTTEHDPQTGKLVWRELKAAAVYEGAPPGKRAAPRKARRAPRAESALRRRVQAWATTQTPSWTLAPVDQAVRVTYVARTEPYARFAEFLWKELVDRGLGTPVRDLAVVADGSSHPEGVVAAQLRLPDVQLTHILDLPHAQAQLWALSKTVFGEGTAASVRWVQAPLEFLERGQVDDLCAAITAIANEPAVRSPAAAEEAATTAAFFRDRAAQLAYPTFLAQGYQIGSGLAESACKRFGTDRMKGAGMRWTVSGAQKVATLRLLLLSDRWAEVSAHCQAA